jgi:hypothetical protein
MGSSAVLGWLLLPAAVSVNLHALAALVLSQGKVGPELRRWSRRWGWFVVAFVVRSTAVKSYRSAFRPFLRCVAAHDRQRPPAW